MDPSHDSEDLNKYAWGSNSHGQLGMPHMNKKAKKQKNAIKSNKPEKIPFLSKFQIREIACGLEHVVAVVDVPMPKQGQVMNSATKQSHVDKLRKALAYLANGEFEDDVYDEGAAGTHVFADKQEREEELGLHDQARMGGEDVIEEGEEGEEEDDDEKLHYPKQIYDRGHDVSPLIIRLGLHEYAELFENQVLCVLCVCFVFCACFTCVCCVWCTVCVMCALCVW